jgi:hypothetical protein
MNEPAFYTKDTAFNISRAVISSTPENAAILQDLDSVADELEILRDAHVPVLWRPLHEANGRWFWWGAGGPEPMKTLWRLMFESFTVKHRLNNLIWVFSPGAETDLARWYPGDAFVDIVGVDHYPMDGNHGAAKDIFDELVQMTRGKKLVALGENGPIPDIGNLVREKAGWLFFTTWSGSILFEKTSPQELREDYYHPYVLTLTDLPNLSKYPIQPVGGPVKLGFYAPPGDVAVNGERRMPLTVAVQDRNGKTVREGVYSVNLALKQKGGAALSGNLTAKTVNGIATFDDVKINKAGDGYRLVASADRLKTVTSSTFRVGPGDGLLREWWQGLKDFSTQPDGVEIIGKAVECPVTMATNFSSRITAEIIPPQPGIYKFWVAGAGELHLWLGADASPSSKVEIATVTHATPYSKWPHTSETASESLQLKAGTKYYFEIRQTQNSGSTQLQVGWRLPDGSEERPIPGFRFAQPEKPIKALTL